MKFLFYTEFLDFFGKDPEVGLSVMDGETVITVSSVQDDIVYVTSEQVNIN